MKKIISLLLSVFIVSFSFSFASDRIDAQAVGEMVADTTAVINSAVNSITGGSQSDAYVVANYVFAQQFNPQGITNAADCHPFDSAQGSTFEAFSDTTPLYSYDGNTSSPANAAIGNMFAGHDPSQPFVVTVTFQQAYNVETNSCSDVGQTLDSSAGSLELVAGTETDVDCYFQYNESTGTWDFYLGSDFNLDPPGLWVTTYVIINGVRVEIPPETCRKQGMHGEGVPPDGRPPEDNPPSNKYGKATYNLDVSTTPFVGAPHASAGISNPDKYYNVSEAIPTSEELEGTASAVSSVYNILARTTKYTGYYEDVYITVSVDYAWPNGKKKNGIKQYDDETEKLTLGPFCYDPQFEKSFYDVPKSNIYPLVGGSASAQHADGYSVGNVSIGGGTGGPSSQILLFNYNFQKIDDVQYTYDGVIVGKDKKSAKEAANAKCKDEIDRLKKELDTIIEEAVTPINIVDYSFAGLTVNSGGINGSPSVGNVSNSNQSTISKDYPNGTYEGQGSASWRNGATHGMAPNNVIVHTPVVNYTTKNDVMVEKFINQKITKEDIVYLQLDKMFTVTIPDSGDHISSQGYGNKIYNTKGGKGPNAQGESNWGAIKDFKFSADMYVLYDINNTTYDYKTFLLPANTWLSEADNKPNSIDLTKKNMQQFLVPVWVTEGKHTIYTRVIAENAKSNNKLDKTEDDANKNITNYVATKNIPVEIIGRIYDLQVSNSTDVDWMGKVQSSKYNKDYVLANEFPFGSTYVTNDRRSQNKNSLYRYAPKLGYTFVFNFKTKGRKSSQMVIDVTKFSFVSKNGGSAQEVDLYYQPAAKGSFVKITNNVGNLKITPADAYVGIPSTEMLGSGIVYPIEKTLDIYSKWIPGANYNYKQPVSIGNFKQLTLPHNLRFVYDNMKEYVNGGLYKKIQSDIEKDAQYVENSVLKEDGAKRVLGSVGHWYAGYVLPPSTVAVPKNANPSDPTKILKNGYILVSFGIKSQDISDGNKDYLQYTGPEARFDTGEEKPGEEKPPIEWPGPDEDTPIGSIPPDSVPMYESDFSITDDNGIGIEY